MRSAKAKALAMCPTLVADRYRQFARSPLRWWIHAPGSVGSLGEGRTEAKAWHAAVKELETRGAAVMP